MKRFVLAAVTVAAFGPSAFAQQPAPVPVPAPAPGQYVPGHYATPPPTLVPVPHPDPVPPIPTYSGTPGPAIPYAKSGGRVVGLGGYYPYDTGLYLLADGAVSRQAGYFTMVLPGGNAQGGDVNPTPAAPAGRKGLCFKNGIFRH